MERLEFLIGTWKTEGQVRPEDTNPGTIFTGTDTYEWILDKNFILHKVNVVMGNEKIEALEIIGGLDVKGKTYKMRSFDNSGGFTEMDAHIDVKGILHLVGSNMRSQLVRKNQNILIAHWERLVNDEWVPWMDLQLTK
jgi:hypothetical protein